MFHNISRNGGTASGKCKGILGSDQDTTRVQILRRNSFIEMFVMEQLMKRAGVPFTPEAIHGNLLGIEEKDPGIRTL